LLKGSNPPIGEIVVGAEICIVDAVIEPHGWPDLTVAVVSTLGLETIAQGWLRVQNAKDRLQPGIGRRRDIT